MPNQKIFLYLYFIVSFLDTLGVFFPETLSRKYTTFFPLPILLCLYFFSVKKINWYYTVAVLFTFLGVIFFNTRMYFKIGILCYAIGVLFYVIISLKQAAVISAKSICIATIPFLIIYLVPLILYADAVGGEVFNYIILYAFFVGFFFLISTLVYINQKNERNLWLFSSGILFLISTIMHGYNMFFGHILALHFGVVATFLFMHFSMYKYVIKE
jgi:hypothetical protein